MNINVKKKANLKKCNSKLKKQTKAEKIGLKWTQQGLLFENNSCIGLQSGAYIDLQLSEVKQKIVQNSIWSVTSANSQYKYADIDENKYADIDEMLRKQKNIQKKMGNHKPQKSKQKSYAQIVRAGIPKPEQKEKITKKKMVFEPKNTTKIRRPNTQRLQTKKAKKNQLEKNPVLQEKVVTWQENYKQACESYNEQDYDKALTAFSKIREKKVKKSFAYKYNLAFIYFKLAQSNKSSNKFVDCCYKANNFFAQAEQMFHKVNDQLKNNDLNKGNNLLEMDFLDGVVDRASFLKAWIACYKGLLSLNSKIKKSKIEKYGKKIEELQNKLAACKQPKLLKSQQPISPTQQVKQENQVGLKKPVSVKKINKSNPSKKQKNRSQKTSKIKQNRNLPKKKKPKQKTIA